MQISAIIRQCETCYGAGTVIAYSKDVSQIGYQYVFRCSCPQSTDPKYLNCPEWKPVNHLHYVPTRADHPVTLEWMTKQLEDRTTQTPEFQQRMLTWGRPLFDALYRLIRKRGGLST